MEEQKILFADLFRLTAGLKDELKELTKEISEVLIDQDWNNVTMTVNGIAGHAARISLIATGIRSNIDDFLACGPYLHQTGDRLPMEALAEET